MVGLLSQMEGSDNSMVSNTNHSMVASEQSTVGQIDNAGVVDEAGEGLIVKDEKPSVQICQKTEPHKDSSEAETVKSDDSSNVDNVNEEEVYVKELKSILKRRGQYTMRKVKVDFDLIPKRIPFDETKDYTVEIQIVDKEPVKIKSWAALFAAKKAEAEAEEAAVAEAEAALKKAEDVQKREALKRANKAKLLKKEGDIKSVKKELQLLKEKIKTEGSVEDQQPVLLAGDQQMAKQAEDSSHEMCEATDEERASEMLFGEPAQRNSNVEGIIGLLESKADDHENSNVEASIVQFDEVADEVSERLSEDVESSDGEQVYSHPLEEGRIESEAKARISMDESTSGDGISSIEVDLLEKENLPKEILVTAVSLVEEILAETPVRLKAVSFEGESEINCTSVNTDIPDSGKGDVKNEDRTESSIDDLPNEDKTESISEGFQDAARSDSAAEELQRSDEIRCESAEEVQHDTVCSSESVEHEAGNTKKCSTDEHKAKVNNAVVSQKLQESLKKATPEIIQTAVRVLVEIEKVTLAVVKNLEPLVP